MQTKTTGTREWADCNFNLQTGCEHDCRYCYAKAMAIRFKRATAESWRTPMQNKEWELRYPSKGKTVMFPSSHDITKSNLNLCVMALRYLLRSGNKVLIVTKGHSEALWELREQMIWEFGADSMWRNRLEFRISISTLSNTTAAYWEPGAPTIDERLLAARETLWSGFRVSISCEPLLDPEPWELIRVACRHTNNGPIWIGKANRLASIVALNCPGDAEAARRAKELEAIQTPDYWRDLYAKLKDATFIRWKDSVRQVVGANAGTEARGNRVASGALLGLPGSGD